MNKTKTFVTHFLIPTVIAASFITRALGEDTPADPASIKDIKAYCLDFNWRNNAIAPPGSWKDADPAQHVAWYKTMGANVIQTFCVSLNGYAWYKNGFVPEQPGLKHDFLTEVVKLGHKEGKAMVGKHTRLITCLAKWNGQDATKVVPEALKAGVGLYGFTPPRDGVGLVPLEDIFPHQVGGLIGDDRSIAMLARAYQGKSIEAVWTNGVFVEPAVPSPFQILIAQGGRRSPQNSARVLFEKASAVVTVWPAGGGMVQMTRRGESWPKSIIIRLQVSRAFSSFQMASSTVGFQVSLNAPHTVTSQKMEGRLELDRLKAAVDKAGNTPLKVVVTRTEKIVDIQIPAELTAGNPEVIAFEWN